MRSAPGGIGALCAGELPGSARGQERPQQQPSGQVQPDLQLQRRLSVGAAAATTGPDFPERLGQHNHRTTLDQHGGKAPQYRYRHRLGGNHLSHRRPQDLTQTLRRLGREPLEQRLGGCCHPQGGRHLGQRAQAGVRVGQPPENQGLRKTGTGEFGTPLDQSRRGGGRLGYIGEDPVHGLGNFWYTAHGKLRRRLSGLQSPSYRQFPLT